MQSDFSYQRRPMMGRVEENLGGVVQALQRDLEQYARYIAGVSCPTECRHFNLFDEHSEHGCDLSTPTPLDCLESTAGDVARWLAAKGWRPPQDHLPVLTTSAPVSQELQPKPAYKIVRVYRLKAVVRAVSVRRSSGEAPHYICVEE